MMTAHGNWIVCCSIVVVLCLVAPAAGAAVASPKVVSVPSTGSGNRPASASQYWGLIFAVGYYYNRPDADRPEMIESANDLYSVLTGSANWQADHIRMLTANTATGKNLISDLQWLAQNSKAEDYVLVYITTHGAQLKRNGLPWDLWPKDEADGMDEFLFMYNGFNNPFSIVWDDLLNFFLSRITCQGMCLIVDSCFSGGFADAPMNTGASQAAAQAYVQDFARSLSGQNRVVLMSTQEDAVSWGAFFSSFIIDGLNGAGDLFGNRDGVNSAEEAFAYAAPQTEWWVWFNTGESQTPVMVDNYPGELPLTW